MEFTLRPFRMADAQSIQVHANNSRIAQFMRDGFANPFTLENANNLIQNLLSASPSKVLSRAICIEDYTVGSIGLFVQDDVYRKTADIAYWLGECYWGRGIMPEAIKIVCAQAFSLLDIVRIQAEPFANNHASHRALEKAGFVKEGMLHSRVCKNGQIQDAFVYALLQ